MIYIYIYIYIYTHTTGDVDVLIMPPPGTESCTEILPLLLDMLHEEHFLTDDLTLP
jgi:hypothetical protein